GPGDELLVIGELHLHVLADLGHRAADVLVAPRKCLLHDEALERTRPAMTPQHAHVELALFSNPDLAHAEAAVDLEFVDTAAAPHDLDGERRHRTHPAERV